MLLRRVIQHLRKQEWMAIAIDFVIVVVGVFIGLQVNEWSAGQAAHRRGNDYVERLIRDLEEDIEGRRALVAYYEAVRASGERTDALLDDQRPSAAALVVDAYRASELAYRRPTRATWDEIVSSGDVALLPGTAVQDGLSDYFSFDAALNLREAMRNSAYRHRVRSIIPHAVQESIRERCGDVRDRYEMVVGFRPDCELGQEPGALNDTARSLQQDAQLRAELRYQLGELAAGLNNLRGDVAYLESALAALRDAQARS